MCLVSIIKHNFSCNLPALFGNIGFWTCICIFFSLYFANEIKPNSSFIKNLNFYTNLYCCVSFKSHIFSGKSSYLGLFLGLTFSSCVYFSLRFSKIQFQLWKYNKPVSSMTIQSVNCGASWLSLSQWLKPDFGHTVMIWYEGLSSLSLNFVETILNFKKMLLSSTFWKFYYLLC